MNRFKVGINFDFNLLNEFKKLNEEFLGKSRIVELYGSDMEHASLAARPDFRLPDINFSYLKRYVRDAVDAGIKFNYTMNSIFPYGAKNEFVENESKIIDFVKALESIGVYRVTVANPIMLELIRNKAKSNIEIEISTIMHIDTIMQIKYLHEKYGVNKICGSLLKNRNFAFLKSAADYCNKNGIIYEVMANEFCGVGGCGYGTHCVYRDSCYICHATNKTLDDANSFDEYPMKLCTGSRNKDAVNWLRMKFIRPEDLHYYREVGINDFKITGRTGSSEYILSVIRGYMSESWKGNLLSLWKPLESIQEGVDEFDVKIVYIDNSKLDGFLTFFKNAYPCDIGVCGETCNYCKLFYEKII